MNDFELLGEYGHEQIIYCSNKESGLNAIIAIHDTTLGPALGGTRMKEYSNLDEAVKDALRLSRGMTYKASAAGLNFGGGKAVILNNGGEINRESLFRTFGKYVDGLGGRFIAAEDVGTDVDDMEYARMETKYVTGFSKAIGGSGDPSPVTSYGVYLGIKASAKKKWGSDSIAGKKIAVQGVGLVGSSLCEHLYNEGAELIITDIDENKVKNVLERVKAEAVAPEEIYGADAEIFSPCALGAIINNDTIPKLRCEIIAGGANNQLEDEKEHAMQLSEKGILYAPDYVINAGGLINVANELEGYRQDRAMKQAENIYSILEKVFELAEKNNVPTHEASNMIAEERLENVGRIRNIYSGESQFSGRLGEIVRR